MNYEERLINKLGLKPGDRIVIPKSSFDLVQHHSLYLGWDSNGVHYVCENVIGKGVKLTQIKDFFKNITKVTRIEKFNGTKAELNAVISRALQNLGKPYFLINYNCEHFVNDALYKTPKSNQIDNVFGMIGLASLVAVVGLLITE